MKPRFLWAGALAVLVVFAPLVLLFVLAAPALADGECCGSVQPAPPPTPTPGPVEVHCAEGDQECLSLWRFNGNALGSWNANGVLLRAGVFSTLSGLNAIVLAGGNAEVNLRSGSGRNYFLGRYALQRADFPDMLGLNIGGSLTGNNVTTHVTFKATDGTGADRSIAWLAAWSSSAGQGFITLDGDYGYAVQPTSDNRGALLAGAPDATSGSTTRGSSAVVYQTSYWDGASPVNERWTTGAIPFDTSGSAAWYVSDPSNAIPFGVVRGGGVVLEARASAPVTCVSDWQGSIWPVSSNGSTTQTRFCQCAFDTANTTTGWKWRNVTTNEFGTDTSCPANRRTFMGTCAVDPFEASAGGFAVAECAAPGVWPSQCTAFAIPPPALSTTDGLLFASSGDVDDEFFTIVVYNPSGAPIDAPERTWQYVAECSE